jgi:hypothetical protein
LHVLIYPCQKVNGSYNNMREQMRITDFFKKSFEGAS